MATNEEVRVSKELRAQARELGLCDEWYNAWRDHTPYSMLIQKMIDGYDFCVEKDWPSAKYVCDNFPVPVLRENGVFCNDTSIARNMRNVIVMGDSVVKLEYNDFSFGDVRVRHSSKAEVHAESLAIVHIHAYEHADVAVFADEGAKVTLYVHNKSVKYVIEGDIDVVGPKYKKSDENG